VGRDDCVGIFLAFTEYILTYLIFIGELKEFVMEKDRNHDAKTSVA
jgi:hypothetical protein